MEEKPIASAYIRDGDNVKITGIPDGTYYIFFSAGNGWDGSSFTERATYQRFEESFPFSTSGLNYSVWRVTLHPVADGNATAEEIDSGQFPELTID